MKIIDTTNTNNSAIVIWNKETLNDIIKKSGSIANSCEIQIHYHALVNRITLIDGSIMDICFPTVVFNYKQEVTHSHVDFELTDVEAMSAALTPVAQVLNDTQMTYLNNCDAPTKFCNEIGIPKNSIKSVEYFSTFVNTLHKHPTGVASFSGTDLSKRIDAETGVVFPLVKGSSTPSFSSIIYNNPIRMIRTEYRLATGDVSTPKGITYQKGNCITITYGKVDRVSIVNKALFVDEDAPKTFKHNLNNETMQYEVIESSGKLKIKQSIVDLILKYFASNALTPNTDFIYAENITAYKSAKMKTTKPTYSAKKQSEKPGEVEVGAHNWEMIYAQVDSIFEKCYDVVLLTQQELDNMDEMSKISHLEELETAYYGAPTADPETTNDTLDLDIAELQITILQEFIDNGGTSESEPSINQMKKELAATKIATMNELDRKSDTQVRMWYKALKGEDF